MPVRFLAADSEVTAGAASVLFRMNYMKTLGGGWLINSKTHASCGRCRRLGARRRCDSCVGGATAASMLLSLREATRAGPNQFSGFLPDMAEDGHIALLMQFRRCSRML